MKCSSDINIFPVESYYLKKKMHLISLRWIRVIFISIKPGLGNITIVYAE